MEISELIDVIPKYMQKICFNYAPSRSKEEMNNTHIKILIAIGKNPGVSLHELSKLVMMDQGALSRIIKKFSIDNLIRQERSEKDRRVTCIFLEKTGNEIYLSSVKKIKEYIDNTFSKFTEDEREDIVSALETLGKYLDKF
ncbi:MarR family transcriptional regulator [Clostridiaceae bacterium HSG29]|nr:MarR family transcriptional regulator [Clostridiaceae bacterium HSG29]